MPNTHSPRITKNTAIKHHGLLTANRLKFVGLENCSYFCSCWIMLLITFISQSFSCSFYVIEARNWFASSERINLRLRSLSLPRSKSSSMLWAVDMLAPCCRSASLRRGVGVAAGVLCSDLLYNPLFPCGPITSEIYLSRSSELVASWITCSPWSLSSILGESRVLWSKGSVSN